MSIAWAVLEALLVSSVVLLVLFIGFCVLFNLPKQKPGGRGARVVRSLDERLGERPEYFPPDAPRGGADQLHTPELLEAAARKSA